eukprot:CAMPEP_0202921748 /NCGR_PEP_ID=MMETSP1392-20130828/77561_1 /ASSEMBLY_ACC=CAM_ASM_000868 /TAXON_ID=225041 /ORGANISM="Chlamydomonas chlamydogama, Strain SAG 11-48b" /LENGTH=384 /DNA_ID=CAMNT_0049615339 /DNA_START=781 /DNA_END=1935 /DNA_ORIENTATION=-
MEEVEEAGVPLKRCTATLDSTFGAVQIVWAVLHGQYHSWQLLDAQQAGTVRGCGGSVVLDTLGVPWAVQQLTKQAQGALQGGDLLRQYKTAQYTVTQFCTVTPDSTFEAIQDCSTVLSEAVGAPLCCFKCCITSYHITSYHKGLKKCGARPTGFGAGRGLAFSTQPHACAPWCVVILDETAVGQMKGAFEVAGERVEWKVEDEDDDAAHVVHAHMPMLSMHTCPCCPCTHAATCVWCLHAHACQVTGCVVCGWCPCMRCMHVTWQCEGGGWAGVEGVSAAQPPSCLLAQVSLGMFVVVVMLVVIVTVMLIGRCWAVLCMHHVHHAMNDDDDDDVLQHGMEHGVEALVKQSRWLASNVTITTTLRGNMMNETGCMEGFGTRMGIW